MVEASEPLQEGGFSVSFTHVVGIEADEVAKRGGLADFTVLARPAVDSDLDLSQTLDASLFDTGRPVLLVSELPVASLLETVAIAWTDPGRRRAPSPMRFLS